MQSGPADLRATFELFRFYRPEVGLERLLQDAGIGLLSPRQIYHAVHDRPPDSLEGALQPTNYDPIRIFIAALSSAEFQQNLAARLLAAFPEKHRLFFVHIPRTAGVDLASHLTSRYPSLSTTLLDPALTPTPEQIFLAIKHLVLELNCSDTIFISGHTHLGTYRSWNGNGVRYRDHVFTVVRDPLDQILSQINYTLTRIFSTEDPVPPDAAGWRCEFGVEDHVARPSRNRIMELARQILRHPGVVVPNVVCGFLGGGLFEQAVIHTVAHDLEVVDLKRLDTWYASRWNITQRTRLNSSEKFVSAEDLSSDELDYARSIMADDVRYYQLVTAACDRHGEAAVRGSRLIQ